MTETLGELCAGYGGLGMAVEKVFKARLAWYSEYDAAPSRILSLRWPGVSNLGDMTKINWASVEPVTVLSAGTPCQDLSHAGARKGMTEGTRSNLWVQMREAIATLQPTWVVWENVRGAYSAGADSDLEFCPGCMGDTGNGKHFLRALGRVLGDLSDLGFDAEWRGLRAADVGACHGRFRVFVLARRRPTPDRDSKRHERPRDARGRWTRLEDGRFPAANPTSIGRGEGWPEPTGQFRRLDAPLGGGPFAANTISSGRDGRAREARREALGGAFTERPGEGISWGKYELGIRRQELIFGRRVTRPTEPTGRNGGHRLSPRFTEWMMGLPEGWVTDPAIGISRNEQLKACGNGVVPQQAEAALRDMLATFQAERIAA